MRHPLTKTLMARWLEAGGASASRGVARRPRAQLGSWGADESGLERRARSEIAQARHMETGTLTDHAIGMISGPDGHYLVAQAGASLAALFGRKLLGTPFGWIFRDADREDVRRTLHAAEEDGLACLLSADMPLAQGGVLNLEALLMPGATAGSSMALSGVIAPFTVPVEGDIRSPFLHLRSSRFVAHEAGAARRAPVSPPLRYGTPNPARPGTFRWIVHSGGARRP